VKRREEDVDAVVGSAGSRHSEQNLADGEISAPQLAHADARRAPHSSQYFALALFWCPHFKHTSSESQQGRRSKN